HAAHEIGIIGVEAVDGEKERTARSQHRTAVDLDVGSCSGDRKREEGDRKGEIGTGTGYDVGSPVAVHVPGRYPHAAQAAAAVAARSPADAQEAAVVAEEAPPPCGRQNLAARIDLEKPGSVNDPDVWLSARAGADDDLGLAIAIDVASRHVDAAGEADSESI